jgi:adenine-specific DNA-methyltransferase
MPKLKTARKKKEIAVETYSHKGKKRKNNPHVGLVSSATDKIDGRTRYQHDPHIDPYLSWAGKQEGMSFDVQNVSLHIHERIEPQRIVKSFLKLKDKKSEQLLLFEDPANDPPLNKAIDFYRHEQDWTNRLIAGDSLLVMNSLLHKEGMAGKVQMIYIDPPYGIKYNSNFQPFVNKRDVKDGNDADIPAEPEMIQAFRDTWELGIHSYLTYLRDRLLLAKELLHESGSLFVQISDENIHFVRAIMDEIFGKENFYAQINVVKTSGLALAAGLAASCDYLLWYVKNRKAVKYRQLYMPKEDKGEGLAPYKFIELKDGMRRPLTKDELNGETAIPLGAKRYRYDNLTKPGPGSRYVFEYKEKKFEPGKRWWGTTPEGMQVLADSGRLELSGATLWYVRFWDDFPWSPINNLWTDTSSSFLAEKIYVVQTTAKIIERCVLMTTDPGDLVFDPTCGSGTTAYVAELWGRRWITCDTSRVAVTLAKQRLMTAKFDYYELAHASEGLKSGFKYKTVPHITLASLVNKEAPKEEVLYDQPAVEKNKIRVTGPFTVEAVPSLRVRPFDGKEPKVEAKSEDLARTDETGKQAEWRDELKATGIRAVGGKIVNFSRVEPMAATRFLHAEGEILESDHTTKRAYISFGPDYGPIEQRQVEEAIKEARSLKEKPDFVIFAAFHFDPEAAKDIDEINWPGVKILKAQMSVDLLTKDLRKKRSSSQSYWLIGQPDVEVIKLKDGRYKVEVHGFDYYYSVS